MDTTSLSKNKLNKHIDNKTQEVIINKNTPTLKQTILPRHNLKTGRLKLNDKTTTTVEISINHELKKKVPKNVENNTTENEKTLLNSNYTKDEIKSLQYKSRLRKKFLGNCVTDDIEFSNMSLPYPAPGCKCNIFSQIFDNFEDKIK